MVNNQSALLSQASKNAEGAAIATAATAKKLTEGTNRIINQGLTRAISGGIQTIANSIAQGKDIFKDFGNFLLGTFGDLAIQLGEFFIAEGIATQALLAVNAPAATIAAGAGLVALGSILKSFAGGGVGGGNLSGGGARATNAGESGLNQTELADVPLELRREQEKPQVSLTVNGSIFNNEETARNIADLLSDAFDKKGVVLASPRFA